MLRLQERGVSATKILTDLTAFAAVVTCDVLCTFHVDLQLQT
ncbi:hypothetical protein EC915_11340 [Pseudomonas sp. LP_7_YM]|nr:hypothetical protein EC915_11340 [Pseudomonas sp. LP_7_YM]